MVVTVQWQMSHARQPDVFQTAVLPPTQADSFLPRRSSLSDLLTIPQTLGGRDPGKTAKKKFQACAIRVLVGWYIDTVSYQSSIDRMYISDVHVCVQRQLHAKQLERDVRNILDNEKRNLSS